MPDNPEFLPIKVVVTSESEMTPPRPGGGKRKSFKQNYERIRGELLLNLREVKAQFEAAFVKSRLPAVAHVRLATNAIAKSHRPDRLLQRTCPIIGGESFGELLTTVRPQGLANLTRIVENTNDPELQSDIGKISRIWPHGFQDIFGSPSVREFLQTLERDKSRELKLRLFTHRDDDVDREILAELQRLLIDSQMPEAVELKYGGGLRIYRVRLETASAIERLGRFVGTQSVTPFEHFHVSTQATPIGPVRSTDLPPPEPEAEYPVVGIIDSGTDPNNRYLQAWVEERDEVDVPSIDQDNTHGSFIAGLLVNARGLNHNTPGFPSRGVKILDVVAYPSTGVREDVLLESIRRALKKHSQVKVWNLSLNTPSSPVVSERFSSFAIAIDSIQDEFGVTIVNSAGNLLDTPAHPWPRPDLKQRDRITAPADSLRAITVGAQAHLTRHGACAKIGEPSPFTRKGPGAAYVPKPEVTHFGGNADAALSCSQIGLVSVDGMGRRAEGVGTSFAAPLVSGTVGQIREMLATPASRNLIKALVVHSAVLHSPEVSANELPYRGFGRPPEPEQILRCRPWEATLIFELDIPYARRVFQKLDFPIPKCLHSAGKVSGEITLTMVYDPPIDANDGAAYSQVNIDCSLGTCRLSNGGQEYGGREVIPYPKDISELFEKNQIEHGFKWSPVKVFRRRMHRVTPGDTWRIGLEMMFRKPDYIPPSRQNVVLIATVSDPERRLPVYNEAAAMMARSGWVTENLQLRGSARVRAR